MSRRTARATRAAAALVLVTASTAAAWELPSVTRQGGSGILDVPFATTLPPGAVSLGAELRLTADPRAPWSASPAHFSAAAGLPARLEAGVSVREGGLPGDPAPAPLLFGASLRWQALGAAAGPALGLEVSVARLNWQPRPALNLLATVPWFDGRGRLTASAGVERDAVHAAAFAATGAVGFAWGVTPAHWVSAEVVYRDARPLAAAGFEWRLIPGAALTLSAQWGPRGALGASVGIAFRRLPAAPRPPEPPPTATPPPSPVASPGPAGAPEGDRARFPLKEPRPPLPSAPVPGEVTP